MVKISKRAWLAVGAAAALVAVVVIWSGLSEVSRGSSPLRVMPAGTGQWTSYGSDPGGSRYSDADQITPENVRRLKVAWTYRTGDLESKAAAMSDSGFEATPILAAGSVIFCTPFNEIVALDPATGRQKWRYDPKVSLTMIPGNAYVCRGVSYWRDTKAPADVPCASRIFMGTVDARLIAVDALTGRRCRDFGQDGQLRVDPGKTLEWPGEYAVNSAPAILADTVVIGSSISDNRRVDAPHGTVRAFDARTGALRWDFDPIPRRAMDPDIKTWRGTPPAEGQANVWSTISVDVKRNIVFLPTSSPSVDYYGGNRPGDNRNADSVVALNGDTGRLIWAFQTVHHNVWDYDVPSQPGLYTIRKDGKLRDVVVTVTKTGFVFVLDRETGVPVFPVEERPVPQDGVPGEVLSPTQPFPVLPKPLAPSRISSKDVFGFTPWDKAACRRRVEALRSDGLFTPPSLGGSAQYPFTGGGANWGSAAFHPGRNVVIVNTNNLLGSVTLRRRADQATLKTQIPAKQEISNQFGTPYVMTRDMVMSPWGVPCVRPPWGRLHAIDMDTGQELWRTPLGTTRDLAPLGIALKWGVPNVGGPAVTAGGLVFIAATVDDYLRAFDIRTGRELWKGRLPAGGQATPMSYVWEGRQYVLIAAGGNARSKTRLGDSVVAYALP